MEPAVYILASKRNGTLYVGVTSNLPQRTAQHKAGVAGGFTKKYGVHTLVWYECLPTMLEAIAAEKKLKKWRRVENSAHREGKPVLERLGSVKGAFFIALRDTRHSALDAESSVFEFPCAARDQNLWMPRRSAA